MIIFGFGEMQIGWEKLRLWKLEWSQRYQIYKRKTTESFLTRKWYYEPGFKEEGVKGGV